MQHERQRGAAMREDLSVNVARIPGAVRVISQGPVMFVRESVRAQASAVGSLSLSKACARSARLQDLPDSPSHFRAAHPA